jgi:hypothetical protein
MIYFGAQYPYGNTFVRNLGGKCEFVTSESFVQLCALFTACHTHTHTHTHTHEELQPEFIELRIQDKTGVFGGCTGKREEGAVCNFVIALATDKLPRLDSGFLC